MKNIHLISTSKPSRLYLVKSNNKLGITSNELFYTKNFGSGTQNQHIYITNDEEIKEGDWMYYKHFGEDIVCKYDTMNGQNTNVNEHKPFYQKIILTTDQDLIKDGVQSIDDEFLEWFVKNPTCEFVEVVSELKVFDKNDYYVSCVIYDTDYTKMIYYIVPQEEPKQRAKNYMSLKGALEPNQIKCYCGHTSYCDCSPLEEPKQFTTEMLIDLKQGLDNAIQKSNPLFPNYKHLNKQETLEEAAEKYARKQCDDMYNNQGLTGASWGWETSLDFIAGAKWQAEKMYSEEDLRNAYRWGTTVNNGTKEHFNELFEQFKKK